MILRRIFSIHAPLLIALCAYSIRATGQNRLNKSQLPFPHDLVPTAQQAGRVGQPLVLMVSLPGCPWCELIRRNYLMPMAAEGLPAYELLINDRNSMLRDFQAQRISAEVFSKQLNIRTTPTLLFLNARGLEIAPRIEGVASVDFVGAVLDERLNAAREHLKSSR